MAYQVRKGQKIYEFFQIDKVVWRIGERGTVQAICPIHKLIMREDTGFNKELLLAIAKSQGFDHAKQSKLICDECDGPYYLPRPLAVQQQYVANKMQAQTWRDTDILNLDNEGVPILKVADSLVDGSEKYFLEARLNKHKGKISLVVYAGCKDKSGNKVQLFVDPKTKRLGFDQNNIHPSDMFTAIEATFSDGTRHKISAPIEAKTKQ